MRRCPVGGLTPSLGTLLELKAAVPLPVMVMVRPRPGGFAYGEADFTVMQRDVDLAVQHGADGIVFGILTADGRIDLHRCRCLLRQVGEHAAVFHRAFDVTPDPFEALEQLIDLGFRRVMTSGQEATAYNGTKLIAELICRAARRIEVLPAGGINCFTVADVVARTGCDQVHASLRIHRRRPLGCMPSAGVFQWTGQYPRRTITRRPARKPSPIFLENSLDRWAVLRAREGLVRCRYPLRGAPWRLVH